MLLIAPVGAAVAMNLLLAAAVYFDRGPDPVFSRWVGHFAIATAACMAPAVGAAVVQTGPLAWNGLVSFWVRNGAFAVFVVVMFFVLRRTLARQARQEGVTA
jgi:membrane protein implicated in regulation of membrane protease activity